MMQKWERSADLALAHLERIGAPGWVVTAAAYVMGFEIVHWLNHRADEA